MVEHLSWAALARHAMDLLNALPPEDMDVLLKNRERITRLVMRELPTLQEEIYQVFSSSRRSVRMDYPPELEGRMKREFVWRLNSKLPPPFHAEFAVDGRKNTGYIVRWMMLPAD